MANNPSAGVYTKEIDLSDYVSSAPSTIAAIVGEMDQGPVGERVLITSVNQYIKVFGYPNAALSFVGFCALAYLSEGQQLYVTRVAPGALYAGARVQFSNNLSSIAAWNSGVTTPDLVAFEASDLFHVYAANPGLWNNKLRVTIYPNTKDNDGTFYVDVYMQGNARAVESFLVHLDYLTDGNGVQLNVAEHINNRSDYIRISQNENQADFAANNSRQLVNTLLNLTLSGGAAATKATTGQIMQAWDLYMDPEQVDINMLVNAGYTDPAVQSEMVQICESRMDCIAILDFPPLEQAVQDAINWRRTEMQFDTSYAAAYGPDVFIHNEYDDRRLFVPPSGHVAAAYARTDREFELWFAPAGMNRGRMDVLGVRHVFNQGDRDAVVVHQINPLRVIKGTGIRIWGESTMQTKSSALSNVSVRRLMLFMEKSLSRAVLYAVFDPNDEILRSQLRELCTRFLQRIKDGRGLYDFDVVCDETNNKPETIAAGDLILDVMVDPVISAKRILLRAIVTKTGARFQLV